MDSVWHIPGDLRGPWLSILCATLCAHYARLMRGPGLRSVPVFQNLGGQRAFQSIDMPCNFV